MNARQIATVTNRSMGLMAMSIPARKLSNVTLRVMLAACLALLCAPTAAAQKGILSGTVVARESGQPLPYAIVGAVSLSRELFANDSGAFFFGDVPPGFISLRVRRLGYLPLDTVVQLLPDSTVSLRVVLTRVAARLDNIIVREHPPCRDPGPQQLAGNAELRSIVDQIRLNAEQYKFLIDRYPLEYSIATEQSSRRKVDSTVHLDGFFAGVTDPRKSWKYKPGEVIIRKGAQYSFRIPTLEHFADRTFLDNHCFHYAGSEVTDSGRLLFVDVVAADRIEDADVSGRIFLDPESYQIRRTVLRLSRIPRSLAWLEDFEATTDFKEILPSISIIGNVTSSQTMGPSARTNFDVAFEEKRLLNYRFLKDIPGQEKRRR